MPQKKWTTQEQEDWFNARLPEFCVAMQDKTMARFFPTVYQDWFTEFPSSPPSEEQLQDAKGDASVRSTKLIERFVNIKVLPCQSHQ